MEGRSRQPPKNMINSLISFGNSMMYSTVLTELYNTQLNPTISYLHEPSERRFSLSLDLSEIFKPIFVDRLIFYMVNKRMLSKKDFNDKYKNQKNMEVLENPWITNLIRTGKIDKLDRDVVDDMIDTIYVYDDKTIKIVYNFSDELKMLNVQD